MSRRPTYSLEYFDLFAYRHKIRPQTIRWHRCLRWLGDFGWANSPERCSENDWFPRMKYSSNLSYHFKEHELLSISSIFTIVEYVICIFSTHFVILQYGKWYHFSSLNNLIHPWRWLVPGYLFIFPKWLKSLVTLGYFPPPQKGWNTIPRRNNNSNESFFCNGNLKILFLGMMNHHDPLMIPEFEALFSWGEWHLGGKAPLDSHDFCWTSYLPTKKVERKALEVVAIMLKDGETPFGRLFLRY